MSFAKGFWKKTVVSHGEENAGKTKEHDEGNGTKGRQDTDFGSQAEPNKFGAEGVNGDSKWIGHAKGDVANKADQDEGYDDVDGCANAKGSYHADGQVFFGVFGFLRKHGNGFKAKESKDDKAGAAQNAADAVFAKDAGVLRNEGKPVVCVDESYPADDEKKEKPNFYGYEDVVNERCCTDANGY